MTHGNIRDPLKIKSLKAIGKNQAFYRASLNFSETLGFSCADTVLERAATPEAAATARKERLEIEVINCVL